MVKLIVQSVVVAALLGASISHVRVGACHATKLGHHADESNCAHAWNPQQLRERISTTEQATASTTRKLTAPSMGGNSAPVIPAPTTATVVQPRPTAPSMGGNTAPVIPEPRPTAPSMGSNPVVPEPRPTAPSMGGNSAPVIPAPTTATVVQPRPTAPSMGGNTAPVIPEPRPTAPSMGSNPVVPEPRPTAPSMGGNSAPVIPAPTTATVVQPRPTAPSMGGNTAPVIPEPRPTAPSMGSNPVVPEPRPTAPSMGGNSAPVIPAPTTATVVQPRPTAPSMGGNTAPVIPEPRPTAPSMGSNPVVPEPRPTAPSMGGNSAPVIPAPTTATVVQPRPTAPSMGGNTAPVIPEPRPTAPSMGSNPVVPEPRPTAPSMGGNSAPVIPAPSIQTVVPEPHPTGSSSDSLVSRPISPPVAGIPLNPTATTSAPYQPVARPSGSSVGSSTLPVTPPATITTAAEQPRPTPPLMGGNPVVLVPRPTPTAIGVNSVTPSTPTTLHTLSPLGGSVPPSVTRPPPPMTLSKAPSVPTFTSTPAVTGTPLPSTKPTSSPPAPTKTVVPKPLTNQPTRTRIPQIVPPPQRPSGSQPLPPLIEPNLSGTPPASTRSVTTPTMPSLTRAPASAPLPITSPTSTPIPRVPVLVPPPRAPTWSPVITSTPRAPIWPPANFPTRAPIWPQSAPPTPSRVPSSVCSIRPQQGDIAVGIDMVTDSSCMDGGLGCLGDSICRLCKRWDTPASAHLLPCSTSGSVTSPALSSASPPTPGAGINPTQSTSPLAQPVSIDVDGCGSLLSPGDRSVGIQIFSDTLCESGGLGCISSSCRYCRGQDTPQSHHLAPCSGAPLSPATNAAGAAANTGALTATAAATNPVVASGGMCANILSPGDQAVGILIASDVSCARGGVGCIGSTCRYCRGSDTPQSHHLLPCSELNVAGQQIGAGVLALRAAAIDQHESSSPGISPLELSGILAGIAAAVAMAVYVTKRMRDRSREHNNMPTPHSLISSTGLPVVT